ncbi:MAG TPA: GGDEF domain-containing protein [Candidatus Omnitrophota bacterium]|nr:GGDEF domain-containing protein [Candidatus Omnitrophota bacterium]HPT07147.1 GGDEF domain-containing protein [Candidatus Omnitrophota bacterium]
MLEQAQKDCLTGFFTRDGLRQYLEDLAVESNAHNKPFSVVLIDLDKFKKFNDKFGHIFGDEVLKYTTSTLRLTFFEDQCVFFRYGGDEFIAVLPGKTAREAGQLFKQCITNLARRPFLYKNKFFKICISCGIAGSPLDGKTMDELIHKADSAMYYSKRHGHNLITQASSIAFLKARRIILVLLLLAAMAAAGFVLYRASLNKFIRPTYKQIRNIHIISKPANLDRIILKSGDIIEGKIIAETAERITVNLYLEKGEGSTTVNKAEIDHLERAGVQ